MPRCCDTLKMAKCCGPCGCSLKSGAYVNAIVNLFLAIVFLDDHFLRQLSSINIYIDSSIHIMSVVSRVWLMVNAVILIFGAAKNSKKMVLAALVLSVVHGIAEAALFIGGLVKYGDITDITLRGIVGLTLLPVVYAAFKIHGWLVVNSLYLELDSNTVDIEADPGGGKRTSMLNCIIISLSHLINPKQACQCSRQEPSMTMSQSYPAWGPQPDGNGLSY